MPMVIRVPNWQVADGYLDVFCEECGRWLLRTSAVQAGAEFYVVCKKHGRRTFVVPAAALEQWRNAA